MKDRIISASLTCLVFVSSWTFAAHAQLLPDIGDTLDGPITDTIERSIDETVDETLSDVVDDVTDGAIDALVSDALDPLVTSADIGAALDGTLDLTDDAIAAIRRLEPSLSTTREIDVTLENGLPVMRNEWVLIAPTEKAAQIEGLSLTVLERSDLLASEDTMFVVKFVGDKEETQALEKTLKALGGQVFDRNHVYRKASDNTDAQAGDPQLQPSSYTQAPGTAVKLGLIDTDIDETHPDFAGISLSERDFVPYGDLRPLKHGTAVASIITRQIQGLALNEQPAILAASVFFVSEDGTTGASSSSIISAIDWLAANDVNVLNISLTGPPNEAVEAYIANMQARGIVFVAAVGNEGPASGPLYPEAYDGVIGVTAVNSSGSIYRWANRGPYVDIAALGVNVEVATPGGAHGRNSGTSFAAPIVSAFLACGGYGTSRQASLSPEDWLAPIIKGDVVAGRDEIIGMGILDPASLQRDF